MELAGEDN